MTQLPENSPGAHTAETQAQASTGDAAPADDKQVQNASGQEVAKFVSTIKNIEQQIGEHVIRALQHTDTVAVLTTVVAGPGGQQHLISAAIDPARMMEINRLLASATEQREEEVMCIGFHCLVKPKLAD